MQDKIGTRLHSNRGPRSYRGYCNFGRIFATPSGEIKSTFVEGKL